MRKAIVLATLFTIQASVAQASNWSMVGAACVPGDPAIQNNLHFITAGSVAHKPAATGLITLYCPVTGTWGDKRPTWLSITYGLNVTQSGSTATIKAQLIRLTQSNGTLSMIGSPVSVRTSETTPSRGQRASASFSHPFDFKNSFYYVRVDIERNGPGSTATLYGVGLHCPTCLAN